MRFLVTLALISSWSLFASFSWGQDYVLENPANPAASSVASMAGGELSIVDSTGRRFVYVRRPDLDSPDGQFLAYYTRDADQFLRWPVRNSGSLEIGRVQVGVMTWNESRMQLRRADVPAGTGYVPGSPLHIGTIPMGPETVCIAQIDATGVLQFFIGQGERWKYVASAHPSGLFVPGAPIHLVADPASQVPRVYTVGTSGRFVEVIGGKTVSDLPGPADTAFTPGCQFEVVAASGTSTLVFATDDRGRLWRLDVSGSGPHQMLESKTGILEAGVPLQVLRDGHEVFVIDRRGAIVIYSLDPLGTWHGPEFLADGFVSRGNITAWTRPGATTTEIAAVDRAGRLQVLRPNGMGWTQDTLPGILLPPGTPVTSFATSAGLSLTAVLADGKWVEFFESNGIWSQRVLATGFPQRAPLATSAFGPMLFASDLTGRLIAAQWFGAEWRTFVCVPGYFSGGETLVAPRLLSRKIFTNRPLNAAAVNLRNTTPEELVLRISDYRVPGKIDEIRLPPNGEALLEADRDGGGTLEEVYQVPGPVGAMQQVRRIPLPPKQFYDVVVYANRVTYRYVDKRKQKGPVPNFEESTLVSIGMFPLAPGAALSMGTTLDVFQIATAYRNRGAGAVRVFDPIRRLP
ncbi:MAG: hypothetical protein JWM11_796 [Planctomycetaceae bacterium]|nr:hypothetical protein [Planctomycetaceae bacterium]